MLCLQLGKQKTMKNPSWTSFSQFQLPAEQYIAWHIWNNEKQIQRMEDLSKKFVSISLSLFNKPSNL